MILMYCLLMVQHDMTALMLASRIGHTDIVSILAALPDINVNMKNKVRK